MRSYPQLGLSIAICTTSSSISTRDARSASSLALVGPFLRDQLPMPAEDSVRSEQRGVLAKELATERLALRREPTSLRVGEQESARAELLFQDSYLFETILQQRLLLAM